MAKKYVVPEEFYEFCRQFERVQTAAHHAVNLGELLEEADQKWTKARQALEKLLPKGGE